MALLELFRLLMWLISKCFFIHLGGCGAYFSLCFARLDADDWIGMASLGCLLYLFFGIIPRWVVTFYHIPRIRQYQGHNPDYIKLTGPGVKNQSIRVVFSEPLSSLHRHLLLVLPLMSVRWG